MPEWLPPLLKGIWVVIALSPIWGALVWMVWAGLIRPRMVPEQEIRRLADDLSAQYGDGAEETAALEEDRARRRLELYEEMKWRRIRRELRRRA
jgi:hypothetical protein